MADPFRVADYFSQVIKRGQLEAVTFEDSSIYVAVTREQLATGSLSVEDTATLFSQHKEEVHGLRTAPKGTPSAEQTAATEPVQEAPISVVVSLVSQSAKNGTAQNGLLLLEGKLFRDGRLEPELKTASSPWIPAERLESPSITGEKLTIGSLSDYWKYARSLLGAGISQTASFADAMKLAIRMFEDVAGETVEEFAAKHGPGEGAIQYELGYVQNADRINAADSLLKVYDFLSRQKKMPALVERLSKGWRSGRLHETEIHAGEGLYAAALNSCGSMSDGFPLTDSQRRAVHAFLDGGGSEVTAVSGPPGTGKTTMLQAVVANLVTRRALEQGAPPVIVGTSTNNQAVTNIISSFASVTRGEPGPLDFRWLPQELNGHACAKKPLQSLAVYCPPQRRLSDAKKKFLVEQKDKSQTYSAYSSDAYIAEAKDCFAMSFHGYFGEVNDIPELPQLIHKALVKLDKYRINLIETMRTKGPSDDYISQCSEVEASPYLRTISHVSELKDCTSLEQLDHKLDVTLRYAEFWLAVHYFEAQWLLADFIRQDDRWKTNRGVMERYWRQAAALTPCFVMTIYQVPRYFELYMGPREPSHFDVGRIDLLIVDEAGQVDTPLGFPVFALAKRALVVGDEKQLSPVWSIDEQTDGEVAQGAGISLPEWSEDLREHGLTCSAKSSLMRAASHASSWNYGTGSPGLFLAEHFRCHPDIIGFCNTLLYDGMLQAKRPSSSSKLDGESVAFQWTDVPGSHDSRHGSSRRNQNEAEAIAAWIVENYAHYFAIYSSIEPDANKRVSEDAVIGVVTPFSAQARLITEELRKAAEAVDASTGLPDKLWEKVTVGTAHRLQGAERPIVLFSAVYGQDSGQATFIDQNPELMNVAVSRAKDLFIVFAAANRWNNGKVFGVMSGFAQRPNALPALREDPLISVEEGWAASTPTTLVAGSSQTMGKTRALESGAAAVSLTVVLKGWREAGELRDEDAGMKTSALNARLSEAGVLIGEPGAWEPSKLARALGVVVEQRHNARGEQYESIEYTPQMQELLLGLYREGKL